MQCPKCGADRQLQDLQCPACGVYYAKAQAAIDKAEEEKQKRQALIEENIRKAEEQQRQQEQQQASKPVAARYEVVYENNQGNATKRIIRDPKFFKDGREYIRAYCEVKEKELIFRAVNFEDDVVNLTTGEVLSRKDWKNSLPVINARLSDFDEPEPIIQQSVQRNPRQVGKGEVICPNPNCGYVGKPNKKSKMNGWFFVILLLFYVVPGILYAFFTRGYNYYCPRCGSKIDFFK